MNFFIDIWTKIQYIVLVILASLIAIMYLYIQHLDSSLVRSNEELALAKQSIVDQANQIDSCVKTRDRQVTVVKMIHDEEGVVDEEIDNQDDEVYIDILASDKTEQPINEGQRDEDIQNAFDAEYGNTGWMLK